MNQEHFKILCGWMGIKETASSFCTSRNTVHKCVRLFLPSEKRIEQLLSLADKQLHEIVDYTQTRYREPSTRKIELENLLSGYVFPLTHKGSNIKKTGTLLFRL